VVRVFKKPEIVKKLMEEEKLGKLKSHLNIKDTDIQYKLPKISNNDAISEKVDLKKDYNFEEKSAENIINKIELKTMEYLDNENIYHTIFENVNDEIIHVDKYGKILNETIVAIMI
jgi:hypothetical protein